MQNYLSLCAWSAYKVNMASQVTQKWGLWPAQPPLQIDVFIHTYIPYPSFHTEYRESDACHNTFIMRSDLALKGQSSIRIAHVHHLKRSPVFYVDVWALSPRLNSTSTSELHVDIWAFTSASEFYVDVWAPCHCLSSMSMCGLLHRCLSRMLLSEFYVDVWAFTSTSGLLCQCLRVLCRHLEFLHWRLNNVEFWYKWLAIHSQALTSPWWKIKTEGESLVQIRMWYRGTTTSQR